MSIENTPSSQPDKLSSRSDQTSARESEQIADRRQDWSLLVERIRTNDADALMELYRSVASQARFAICRQLGQEHAEDRVHDIYVAVTSAIRNGVIRQPSCLMGFVRTLVLRTISAGIRSAIRNRRQQRDVDSEFALSTDEPSPEQAAIKRQQLGLLRQLLNEMHPRDKEILARFYLCEQTREQICRDMQLTETQYRLAKSRAKAKIAFLGQKQLRKAPQSVPSFSQAASRAANW